MCQKKNWPGEAKLFENAAGLQDLLEDIKERNMGQQVKQRTVSKMLLERHNRIFC